MTISANFPNVRSSLLLDFSNQTVLDPRVTFTRTTTGNYYDNKSATLAEQNLLLQSNGFSTASWGNLSTITLVQGATDPTGGALGWTLTASATTNYHGLYYIPQPTLASGTYAYSVYLQAGAGAGSTTYATVSPGAPGNNQYASVTFNLSGAGSVTQSLSTGVWSIVSSSIAQIGSTAWYRCVVIFSIPNSSLLQGFLAALSNAATFSPTALGVNSFLALGTETLLVYGAQLEQHNSPTVYTATTSAAVNTYTPTLQVATANAPRFDYDPVTRQSLGLLLEQASTNLALYSSDYTNAAWTKGNVAITPAADISPDGTQNAQLMVLGATSVPHYIAQSTTYTAATYTLSAYVKYYGQQFVQLAYTNATYCNFDLINGTYGTAVGTGAVANIQPVGNGWYRCSLTFTAVTSAANSYIVAANLLTAINSPSFAGNGFNGYLIWGAQVELAPSATSYIATVASAQTRTQDLTSMTGNNFTSWYNYSGGTVYVETATGNPTSAANPSPFSISDGSNSNQIANYFATTNAQYAVTVNGVSVLSTNVAFPTSPIANTFYKISWYFSTAGYGISSAGQTPTTGATSINAPAVNKLALGASSVGLYPLNGHIKKFAYYPTVLTSTQLQSLSAN